MRGRKRASPFVPSEIHVSSVSDGKGMIGILSIWTTEGLLDIALDRGAADAITSAVQKIRSSLNKPIKDC